MADRKITTRPSWDSLRAPTDKEMPTLQDKARKAAERIPKDAREDLQAYLMQTRILRVAAAGCSESALRDIEAERRVAMNLIKILDGKLDADGSGPADR